MVAEVRSISVPIAKNRDSGAAAASGAAAVFRFPRRVIAVVAVTFALLLIPFRHAVEWLWITWTTQLEYSHAPILPLIAAFLLWQNKDHLERAEFTGDWRGTVLVAFAGLMYLIGVFGAAYTIQEYALVASIGGLALALTGARAARWMIAPLLVLVLMVPQPNFILNNLSADLQLLSSRIGVAFVRAMGISVYLEGNVIDLGDYRLQVVEACSGLRYLFPLMTIGLLIAYFYKGAMWKRVTVFLLSVPITILMNSLRIGVIGLMVDRWGTGMAEGFLHEFQGWMVFMLSAALLLGITAALNRLGRRPIAWRQQFGLEFPAPTPAGAVLRERALPSAFVGAAGVVAAIAIASVLLPARAELVPARQSLAEFPGNLARWSGHRGALDPDVRDWLSVDDYVMMDFVPRSGGSAVNFYVSYYDTQRDRRVVHSPRACIPGAGWRIEQLKQIEVENAGIRANRMIVTNGDQRQLIYYWFDQRGRNLTNEFAVKWYLFVDSLFRQRTDGAMVRLVTALDHREPEARADARLTDLARTLAPLLPAYVPH
jgi:exosortase D (VPLPA-CTERM-specific)